MSIPLNERLLDEKLTALEAARTWSPRVISRLETTIRTADDYDLFRINPVQYAAEKGITENEAIDLFLYGTKLGLFEMDWHLVCASCGHVVQSLRALHNLHPAFTCSNCFAQQVASLDDYIQVTFTISAQIRDIIFMHPEMLSVEDFYFKYHICKGISPAPDGTPYQDFLRAASFMLTYLAPGEKQAGQFKVGPGLLQAIDLTHNMPASFLIGEEQLAEPQPIKIALTDGKFSVTNRDLSPGETQHGLTSHFPQLGFLSSGEIAFEIENQMDERGSIWLLHFPMEAGLESLRLEPFLSGKKLLTTQTFRSLFRSEVIAADEGIGVKDITFLFTDLKGSTAMYDEVGDPKAYYLVRQHFDTLSKVVIQHSGAIVKTIGDAIMATFLHPVDAVKASLDMISELDTFNQSISQNLYLKIGIHTGHSIAVTLNEHIDYFGQTVNIASRVQGLADGGEIYLSSEAYNYPGVAEVLTGSLVIPDRVAVKGLTSHLQVYKITTQ